jgi:hypothetical protein
MGRMQNQSCRITRALTGETGLVESQKAFTVGASGVVESIARQQPSVAETGGTTPTPHRPGYRQDGRLADAAQAPQMKSGALYSYEPL